MLDHAKQASLFQDLLQVEGHEVRCGLAPKRFSAYEVFIVPQRIKDNIYEIRIYDRLLGKEARLVTDSMEALRTLTPRQHQDDLHKLVHELIKGAMAEDPEHPISERIFLICQMNDSHVLTTFGGSALRFIRARTRDHDFVWEVRMIKR